MHFTTCLRSSIATLVIAVLVHINQSVSCREPKALFWEGPAPSFHQSASIKGLNKHYLLIRPLFQLEWKETKSLSVCNAGMEAISYKKRKHCGLWCLCVCGVLCVCVCREKRQIEGVVDPLKSYWQMQMSGWALGMIATSGVNLS